MLSLFWGPPTAGAQPGPPVGLQRDIGFDRYSPLSTNDQLMRRLLTPLQAELTRRNLSETGKALATEPVDLGRERFTLYVPPKTPPGGYGLLVFVPPWPEASIPPDWIPVLDRYGVIFVTAAHSGNDASVLGRRIPLAVIEAENVIDRYPVNPQHVYVGGLSGGARVALRVAIAFPDLFRGAFLNAGSDPLGGDGAAVPARPLLYAFQQSSRVVAVTGSDDTINVAKDAETAYAMKRWCAYNFSPRTIAFMGHDLARPDALADALDSLASPPRGNPSRLEACRSALDSTLSKGLQEVQAAIDAARPGEARARITGLDAQFGGFAGDQLVKLAQACRCGVLP
jgi:pimeloyl-ACP methyl ester carboxylesterase